MSREMVCIVCPMGCRLAVDTLPDGGLGVSGNRCQRGAAYANAEFLDPRRTVTATCKMKTAGLPRVPVRTRSAFPKDRIPELLRALYALEVAPPVLLGDVLLEDALGTGIDVIATRSVG